MSNSKEDSDLKTVLNDDLLDEFTEGLEGTINEICENNPGLDPRLELLVTLGLFSAQVGIDSGYSKDEFLGLMSELFDDFEDREQEEEQIDLFLSENKSENKFNLN